MAVVVVNTVGMDRLKTLVEIALTVPDIKPGDIMEVHGDCANLEKDLGAWCERMGKPILSIEQDGGYKQVIQIRF